MILSSSWRIRGYKVNAPSPPQSHFQNYLFRFRFKCVSDVTSYPTLTRCSTQPSIRGNCKCAFDDDCAAQMKFYTYSNFYQPRTTFNIPGLFAGCSVIESVRLSSVKCFFEQSCLKMVMQFLGKSRASPIATPILPSDSSQQYSPDTSMGTVIDALMVDRWNDSVDYKQYYHRCKPRQCSYTITTRGNVLYIFSTIIGIFGGLTIILKIVSQAIVTVVRNRKRTQTESANNAGKLPWIVVRRSREYSNYCKFCCGDHSNEVWAPCVWLAGNCSLAESFVCSMLQYSFLFSWAWFTRPPTSSSALGQKAHIAVEPFREQIIVE